MGGYKAGLGKIEEDTFGYRTLKCCVGWGRAEEGSPKELQKGNLGPTLRRMAPAGRPEVRSGL
jgi:hypothetical protein